MANSLNLTLISEIWKSTRKYILIVSPWFPIYSLAEVTLAFLISIFAQIIFIDAQVINLKNLLPGNLKGYLPYDYQVETSFLIMTTPFLLIVISLIKMFSSFATNYVSEKSGHKLALNLRKLILSKYLNARGEILDHLEPKAFANQVMQDTTLLQSAVSKGTISSIRDMIVLVTIFISMLLISVKITLVGLLIISPVILFIKRASKKMSYYTKESQIKQLSISKQILETHSGILTVSALRTYDSEKEKFISKVKEYYHFMRKALYLRAGLSPFIEVIAFSLLIFAFEWKLSLDTQDFNFGSHITYIILLGFSYRYFKSISNALNQFIDMQVVFKRFNKSLKILQTEKPHKTKSRMNPSFAAELSNITYVNKDNIPILKNCSIKIPFGERVAIIGESGSGKTTFLRLLSELITPSTGHVDVIDDKILLTQTPYIFKGSVKDNILYQTPPEIQSFDEIDAKIEELLLDFGLSHTKTSVKLFANKKINYNGVGLSGGEKARIAMARAILRNPRMLILDEPTANLDKNSQKLFWSAIKKWQQKNSKNTLVVVTHSINEVKDFNQCYVFQNGEIKKNKP